MPIPESDRVIFRNNPLAEVVCQLRFPGVLRIEAEAPAAFQDRIRADYPEYRQTSGLPADLLPPAIAILQGANPEVPRCIHEFAATDTTWSVSLARTFLALKTTQYERWEEFSRRIQALMSTLVEIYRPAYYSRVGLRYVDVIQRSRLGLQSSSWADLLEPHIVGEFAEPSWADEIDLSTKQISLRISQPDNRVMIRHGLAFAEGTNEPCYVFDADFFLAGQRTEPCNAGEILERFHRYAGNLFRWCITPALHDALDPQPPNWGD